MQYSSKVISLTAVMIRLETLFKKFKNHIEC